MRKVIFVVLGVVAVAGWLAFAQEPADALEAKLDQLDAKLQQALYFVDPLGNQELWFNKLNRAIGDLQYDFDVLDSTRLKNMELILTQINNQIDGEALVSDADLAAHEAHVIAQINANEAKIDALEAKADSLEGKLDTLTVAVSALEEKLDNEASFTDDSELATHEANVLAAIDGAESSLAMAIAGVESKLDDEASFTDDTELAAAQSAIISEVDANETKIDAVDNALSQIESKLDGANGLAAIKTDTGNIWGAVNNATYGLSSIKDDTGNIWSTINLADNFGGHTLAEILNAIATLQTDVTQIKNQLNDIYNGTQCVEVCP